MDFVQQFIDAMAAHGCEPANVSEIIADDVKRRYALRDDTRGKKSAVYQLRVDGDSAVGWFLSFKEGVTHKWNSRAKREYSAQEREVWKQKIDAQRAEMAAKIKAERKEAATKAATIWVRCSVNGRSEYLERKGIGSSGTKFIRETVLVVPVWVDGKLGSLQFIAQSGEKRFLRNGEISGGYFSIATKTDDLSTIVICEGFATGASIRQATGLPVVVAFNAGNLKPVAQVMRKKHAKARLVIAADNDCWGAINTGLTKAKQAADAIGGAVVVWPEFKSAPHTDFNDAHLTHGLDYVRDRITAALAHKEDVPPEYASGADDSSLVSNVQTSVSAGTIDDLPPQPPIEAYEDVLPSIKSLNAPHDWRSLMLTNDKGILKPASLRNVILMLKFHPEFMGTFAYNEFAQNITIVKCPPWEREETFKAQRLTDVAVTNTAAELEKYGLTPSPDRALKAIEVAAAEDSFHPAKDYFNGLKWDGKPRLDTWLSYYLGCEGDSPEYLAFVGKKWLTAAVKRVYMAGCKFDHILVIEGEQGAGKSTVLKELATFGHESQESYFTDSVTIADIQNKDTIMKIQGSIIVELSELSGFSKKDDEEIKRWITIQHDDVRLPYGRQTSRFSRQFVLAATTNQSSYLKDPTGNRRYWPVAAGKLDIEALKIDREQLWAEAVHYYHGGLYIGSTYEEERLANKERNKRLAHDPWTDDVLKAATELSISAELHGEGIKISAIMVDMSIALRDRDDRAARRIAGILQLGGWVNKPMWNSDTGKTERFWVRVS